MKVDGSQRVLCANQRDAMHTIDTMYKSDYGGHEDRSPLVFVVVGLIGIQSLLVEEIGIVVVAVEVLCATKRHCEDRTNGERLTETASSSSSS